MCPNCVKRSACARLLERLRQRLEKGQALAGTILLKGATDLERGHLAALPGDSPARGEDVRVDLRRLSTSTTGNLLRLLAGVGEPGYLTVRQLLRGDLEFEPGAGRTIYVCENPTVVAAAARALGQRCAPLVCTQG